MKSAEARIQHLTSLLRGGEISEDERQELGGYFIEVAFNIAKRFGRRRPSSLEDFQGAALFGIAYALNHAQTKMVDNNFPGFVIGCMTRFVRRYYETDHIMRVPSTTYHRALKEGRTIKVPKVERLELSHKAYSENPMKILETKEILQMSVTDDCERTILSMRMEGYNNREIAQKLKVSVSYIQRKRSYISNRFLDLTRG
jgi:DNA-directed RNA polymerase specialized sigma subunit